MPRQTVAGLSGPAAGYALLSPAMLIIAAMLVAPMLALVTLSFWTQNGFELDTSFTLANYWALIEPADEPTMWMGIPFPFKNPVYAILMLKSLVMSLAVTAAVILIAYPMAYFLAFRVTRYKALWIIIITIPFWTSYLIRVFLWKVILGFNGVINSGLMSLGIIDAPLTAINYNVQALVVTLAHAYAPFAILPIFVALEKIDRSFLEAGRDLGESQFMTFLRVTLPLSMPGVIAAVLIVFIPTVGDYVTPDLIGGGKLPMIANRIEGTMLKQNNREVGSAIAVSAMLVVAAVTLIFLLLNRRFLRGQK